MNTSEIFEALEGAIEAVASRKLSRVHTAMPGIIESYSKGVADVKPAVHAIDENGDPVELPVVVGVPVMFPRSSTFALTYPVNVGDSVLLVFCESSIEGFVETGAESTQEDRRRHSLTDAVAIPGLFGGVKGLMPKSWENFELNIGPAKISIGNDGAVDINNGALKVLP